MISFLRRRTQPLGKALYDPSCVRGVPTSTLLDNHPPVFMLQPIRPCPHPWAGDTQILPALPGVPTAVRANTPAGYYGITVLPGMAPLG